MTTNEKTAALRPPFEFHLEEEVLEDVREEVKSGGGILRS